MSDVFISYAKEDRDRAREIASRLMEEGWSVFWDKTIPVGSSWDEILEKELNTAKTILVLWSKNSVVSDWVRAEAEEGANRKILVPANIEPVILPIRFRALQTADISNWKPGNPDTEGMKLLIEAVTRIGNLKSGKELEAKKPEKSKIKSIKSEEEKSKIEEKYGLDKTETKIIDSTKKKSQIRKLIIAGISIIVLIYIIIISTNQDSDTTYQLEPNRTTSVEEHLTKSPVKKPSTIDRTNYRLIAKELFTNKDSWNIEDRFVALAGQSNFGRVSKNVVNGVYRWNLDFFSSALSGTGITQASPYQSLSDLYIATDVKIKSISGGTLAAGVYFRGTSEEGYELDLSSNKYYQLMIQTINGTRTLQNWTYIPDIQTSNFNRLAITAIGDTIRIYINNKLYGVIKDGTRLFGSVGFIVRGYKSTGSNEGVKATVEFDNFELREIVK
jgi:hypothetical protein